MKGRTFAPSLRFKITAGVTLVMVVIVALYAYLHYDSHRALVMRDAGQALTNTSQLIEGTLQHAMLQQDYADLQSIVDNVGHQTGMETVMLLNKESVVRFAPDGKDVGTILSLSDPNCQACHQPARPADQQNIVYLTPQGKRVLRNCNPIENQPVCYRCHDARDRLNGVLIIDYSLAATDAHLAEDLQVSLLLGGGAIVVVILTINLLMHHLVLARLEQVIGVVRRFGQGDLSQRVAAQSHDELGKLAQTFNRMADGLQDENRENEQLYAELQQKEAVRTQLLGKLIEAQEEERKRIARDLHDQLGSTLSGLTMNIEAMGTSLPGQDDPLKQRWQRTKDLAAEALEETHKLILDLRPIVLDDLGLIAAIRADAEARLQPIGVDVQVNVIGSRRRLGQQLELTLFRIVQEAINNIAKHANAQQTSLVLEFQDSIVKVIVEDDGQGFDLEKTSSPEDKMRGLGLLGMIERANLAGGSLEIESHSGRGTRIVVSMPVPPEKT